MPAFAAWFGAHGYDVAESPCLFEGSGDAVWDPSGETIWLGHGFRSSPDVASVLEETFGMKLDTIERQLFNWLDDARF